MKNKTIEISIIIPIYNAEKTIISCLESIIRNTYFEDYTEVILVDDGSSDRSLEICREYAENHDNIKVISQKNGGAGKARNTGLQSANGKWIVFVDADDYISENYFELIVKSQTQAELMIFSFASVGQDEPRGNQSHGFFCADHAVEREYDVSYKSKFIQSIFLSQVVVDPKMFDYNIITVWGKAFRADYLKEINAYFKEDQVTAEDMLFMISVFDNLTSVHVTNDIVYYYVKNTASITNSYHGSLMDDIAHFNANVSEWMNSNPEYLPYFYCYRLNDTILYSKFFVFAANVPDPDAAFKKFPRETYKEYYQIVRKAGLLNSYIFFKRIYFKLFLKGCFWICKKVFQLKGA